LDHVARLSIIGWVIEACRDDHTGVIFVENESVAHRRPPIHSARAGMAIKAAKPKAQSGPWKREGMRSFMELSG